MAQSDVLKHFNTPENVNRGRCCHVDCTKKLTSTDKKALAGPILFERRYKSTEACQTHYILHLNMTKVSRKHLTNVGEFFNIFYFLLIALLVTRDNFGGGATWGT